MNEPTAAGPSEEPPATGDFAWLHDLWRDLRYAGRVLTRSPGFTVAAILTVAMGIGANTVVFSVVNNVILEPLPFQDPDRLVMIWTSNPEIGIASEQVSLPDFFDWRQESGAFERMGYLGNMQAASRSFVLRLDDVPIRVRGRFASADLFDVLGVPALLGHTFQPEDDVRGSEKKAVLSHGLWQRRFASDPNIVGRVIDLGDAYRVVGVMPRRFEFPPDAELWLSWSGYPYPQDMRNRSRHSAWVVGRLKDGTSAPQAEAELTAIQRRIAEANPQLPRISTRVQVVPLLDQVIGPGTKSALILLFGAVAFVLLIACANVANLLLARAMARRKEIVLRAALGASRLRIVRQLITESVLLAVLGGAIGVLFSLWGIDVVEAIRPDETFRGVKEFRFDRVAKIAMDGRVLGFALLASLATGVLFGITPALESSRIDLNEVLKEGGRSTTSARATRRLANSLLIAEVALSVILLVGAVQMLQTFVRLRRSDTGLDTEHVLTLGIDLAMAQRRYSGTSPDIYDAIKAKVESLPGVVSVTASGENPLTVSGWTDSVAIQGREVARTSDLRAATFRVVAPNQFATLGVPILDGRDFSAQDREKSPGVAVVSAEFARQFFGARSPLGESFQFRGYSGPIQIVGVVADVRPLSFSDDLRPEVYLPYRQSIFTGADVGPVLVVRTKGAPERMIGSIRHEVEGGEPAGILIDIRTADQILSASVSRERFQTVLLGFFALAALMLAAVGIYGVVSYATYRRVHEIGIRMALGAERGHVLRLVVGHGLLLASLGVVIGACVSLALARVLASRIYEFASIDAAVLAGVCACLTLAASIACVIPARRAMAVDPMVALRHE